MVDVVGDELFHRYTVKKLWLFCGNAKAGGLCVHRRRGARRGGWLVLGVGAVLWLAGRVLLPC